MAYVSIYYGPYEAGGIVRHRTQRLKGLKEELEDRGHTVELIPSPHWDRVEIVIGGRNVFRCNILNLEYDSSGKEDAVCSRALLAVDDAIARMRPEFLYPDMPAFSSEYLEQSIDEVFRQLNVREHIDKCLETAMTTACVQKVLDDALDESMTGEYVRHLFGEAMEVAFHRDFMEDLINAKLDKYFESVDFLHHAVLDAVDTRMFVTDLLRVAITKTHPDLIKFVEQFVDAVVTETLAQILPPTEFAVCYAINSVIAATMQKVERIEIAREVVAELACRIPSSSTAILTIPSPISPTSEIIPSPTSSTSDTIPSDDEED